MSDKTIIKFVRQKDLLWVKELGRGACGTTALLYDETIDEHFVCKKYTPYAEAEREPLFRNFVREVKLLHALHHPNVVRVFNHYLYPDSFAGYILMEFVDGPDISEYVRANPEQVADLFRQAIEGFCHLEEIGILHRDIRRLNLLVSQSGQLKIIDFGFGKRIETSEDFDKSMSLNLWCERPAEFETQTYTFTTEVYFVGRLFQQILTKHGLRDFKYTDLLERMCEIDPGERIQSFTQVRQHLLAAGFGDIPFSEEQLATYREFSDHLFRSITKIDRSAKYANDRDNVLRQLADTYNKTMLEEALPTTAPLVRCFVEGQCYVKKHEYFPVVVLKNFVDFVRACSPEKQEIILSNVQAKLDAVNRYADRPSDYDFDDIPF